ncbi:hypothetical protein lerEdw1_008418 [Lerista edwardsae]|nr:hypothetical protein lerEdw1_008418 [Lerista edwardsae]
MKLEAVVEQLQKQQKQQQQQQQQNTLQMDSRERQQRQMREAQLHYAQQLTVQQAALTATSGKASGGPALGPSARVPPVLGAARTFDQSSMNSEEEEEEEEEGEEDLEDGDLEDDATITGKDACSALKYFHASKVAPHNQRVASSSNALPVLGAQREQQGKEEQGKEATVPSYPGSPSRRQTWRLDEQLKQVSANVHPQSLVDKAREFKLNGPEGR